MRMMSTRPPKWTYERPLPSQYGELELAEEVPQVRAISLLVCVAPPTEFVSVVHAPVVEPHARATLRHD